MKAFLLVAALIGAFFAWRIHEVRKPVDWSAPTWSEEPIQSSKDLPAPFDFKGYKITPAATYVLTGKVLSTNRYPLSGGSDIAPLDLAMGWGKLSDPVFLAEAGIRQALRAAVISWSSAPPLDSDEITRSFSNNHVIPADAEVEKGLMALRPGDLARLTGLLVSVKRQDGFVWNTSMKRTDVGDGACELIFVRSIEILARPKGR